MRYTLLELTQDILLSMDGDEVDSILDTYESTQVTHLIRQVYYDILARGGLPEQEGPFQLTGTNSTSTPLVMTLPDGVKNVYWVKYDYATLTDTDKQYTPIYYLPWAEFIHQSHMLDESDTTVDNMAYTTDNGTINILYKNDIAPSFYSSFDDRKIVFDSIDTTIDTALYLSGTKTQCFGSFSPTFTFSDSFVCDLDDDQFPLLIAEAKALAWAEQKQAQHQKAEISAKRGWVSQQKNKFTVDRRTALQKLPGYGRK